MNLKGTFTAVVLLGLLPAAFIEAQITSPPEKIGPVPQVLRSTARSAALTVPAEPPQASNVKVASRPQSDTIPSGVHSSTGLPSLALAQVPASGGALLMVIAGILLIFRKRI